MRNIFAIGDLHLSFNSEKPMDIFGPDWVRHHERLKENWLRLIGDEDVVFILGDHSWALKLEEAKVDLDWIDELPGVKILLKGNHDLWWSSVSKLRELYTSMRFIQNDSILIDETALCGTRGWVTPQDQNFKESVDRHVYERELIRLEMSLESAIRTGAKDIIVGMHFPPSAGDAHYSGFTELFERYKVSKVVYGHLHGREAFKKRISGTRDGSEYILASADYLAFTPIQIR